jgi:heat shock protein HtpX
LGLNREDLKGILRNMAVEFNQLIARNKRNSWVLIVAFSGFVVVLGLLIGYAIGLYSGEPRRAPEFGVAFMLGGLALAMVGTTISYYAGASAVLAMSRAREIRKQDDPQLFNVVEEMALAAGVPTPKVYVIDDSAPNAFATGRDPAHAAVAITTGLRTKLTRDELQGVIAHEMSHVRNFDIRFAVLMTTLVGVVVLMCDVFLRTMAWGRWGGSRRSSRSSRDEKGGNGAVMLVVFVLAIILSIIAPLLAKIIEMAFSRQREYLADASAVDLTRNPEGLAQALVKIRDDPDVLEVANRATAPMYIVHPIKRFEERSSSIMDSHPPIEDRIKRLMQLAGPAESAGK